MKKAASRAVSFENHASCLLRGSDNTTLYLLIPAGHLLILIRYITVLDPVAVVDGSFFIVFVEMYGVAGKQRKYPVEQGIPGMFGFFLSVP